MKKTVILALAAAILFSASAPAAFSPPGTSAEAMIVLHAGSGAVLAEKNADTPMLIASTTKLMTALTALDLASPERSVTVQSEWTTVEGSSMYLRAGESYTLRELLEGLLLASGNDAALAIAGSLGGDAFIEQMNRKAEKLGLAVSHFANPHGLDADGHRASAHDLGLIMAAALQNDVLAEILSMRSSCIHGLTYVNHNKLLWSCRGVNGGKTGYTKAAGRCLVTSCERNGMQLICVTLSDPKDWKDHAALYDWAFDAYAEFRLPEGKPVEHVPVIGGPEAESAAKLVAILKEDKMWCSITASACAFRRARKLSLPSVCRILFLRLFRREPQRANLLFGQMERPCVRRRSDGPGRKTRVNRCFPAYTRHNRSAKEERE